jgi:hypothetical protein
MDSIKTNNNTETGIFQVKPVYGYFCKKVFCL